MSYKILLIDDEELITRTLAKALEKTGYELLVAKSGLDGIAMAELEDFDLIICDIKMPGMNGVETINKILSSRKEKPLSGSKVIFISGYADKNLEMQAKAINPKAYFEKPFDFSEFMNAVKAALNGN